MEQKTLPTTSNGVDITFARLFNTIVFVVWFTMNTGWLDNSFGHFTNFPSIKSFRWRSISLACVTSQIGVRKNGRNGRIKIILVGQKWKSNIFHALPKQHCVRSIVSMEHSRRYTNHSISNVFHECVHRTNFDWDRNVIVERVIRAEATLEYYTDLNVTNEQLDIWRIAYGGGWVAISTEFMWSTFEYNDAHVRIQEVTQVQLQHYTMPMCVVNKHQTCVTIHERIRGLNKSETFSGMRMNNDRVNRVNVLTASHIPNVSSSVRFIEWIGEPVKRSFNT